MSEENLLKRTPVYDEHLALGAKMVEFSGWSMPVFYSKTTEEHLHVRSHVGLFDVSHMGEVIVSGPEAKNFLQKALMNDLDLLIPGKGQYTALLNDKGGMIDDLLVYFLKENHYLLCVNASNREKDFKWLQQLSEGLSGFEILDASDEFAQFAVQGPKSEESLKPFLSYESSQPLGTLAYGDIATLKDSSGREFYLARTGYTGEKGYEIYLPKDMATSVWNSLLSTSPETGIKPIGLGARDTLRLEACYPLYGQEMDDEVSPLEIGLSWAARMNKKIKFVGHESLKSEKTEGIRRRLYAFQMEESGIARSYMKVYQEGKEIGEVTSGSLLPSLGKKGGLALLNVNSFVKEELIEIDIRGHLKKARLVKKPMYQAKTKS